MKVFGIAGYSGAGKTTLIEKVIPRLKARGLTVAVIKHTHHDAQWDTPGKDSFRHRIAGAGQVLLTSEKRWVLMCELQGAPEPDLDTQLEKLSPCDMVLVEGFKTCALPKLEVWRAELGKPVLFPKDPWVKVFASDDPPTDCPLPCIGLNDVEAIVDAILKFARIKESRT